MRLWFWMPPKKDVCRCIIPSLCGTHDETRWSKHVPIRGEETSPQIDKLCHFDWTIVLLSFRTLGRFRIVIQKLLNKVHVCQQHSTATVSFQPQFIHSVTAEMYNQNSGEWVDNEKEDTSLQKKKTLYSKASTKYPLVISFVYKWQQQKQQRIEQWRW